MLDEARDQGHGSPSANLYRWDNGWKLVKYGVKRADLSITPTRCWCGRGVLKHVAYADMERGFCSDQHRVLWDQMSDDMKARVIVARFINLFAP
jgi:hypothetical protein